jgi:hypothetical protein
MSLIILIVSLRALSITEIIIHHEISTYTARTVSHRYANFTTLRAFRSNRNSRVKVSLDWIAYLYKRVQCSKVLQRTRETLLVIVTS